MAISQTSPPVITGVCKVGEELTATPGTYESGEIKNTKWYYSENGGADWTVKGLTKTHLLTADDVGRVFKIADVVQEGEGDPEEFDSERTGAIYPADTTIGTVTIQAGQDSATVGNTVQLTAAVSGGSEYLSYAWSSDPALTISDPTTNPVTVTTGEAGAYEISCEVSTKDNTNTDGAQTGSKTIQFDATPEPGPEPEPEPSPGEGVLNSNAQYQADSVVKEYRRRFNRELVVTPVDDFAFMLSGGGKTGSGAKGYVATEGEMEFLLKWFSWRWTGDIEMGANTFTLRVVGSGNFHPSGGVSPRSVIKG